MGTTLHVGNLPASATESDLTSRFQRYGTVESAIISRDSITGASKGFGRVRMASAIEASTAIAQLNLTQQDGLTMIVSKYRAGQGDGL
jgi:RNA recognition motif-containing protein